MTLAERLRTQCPMSFRDWMEACLYDAEEGYYTRRRDAPRTGAGDDADFATSPSLHPFMAQAIAAEIGAAWESLGQPEDFLVVEYGGGRGDLARDALAALHAKYGWQPMWHHVEVSEDHRQDQATPGTRHGPAPERFHGCVVAHEFLDALPVHLVERRMGHWAEMVVTEAGGLMTGMPSKPGNDAAPAIDVPDGHRVAANAAAKAWFADVGKALTAGRVLVVDYGDESMKLWGRDPEWGTIRTFRRHQDGGSPLEDPGEKDITASIDFAQCRDWAAKAGLTEASCETQEAFLLRHGVLEAMNAIDRSTTDGASSYLRLRQLMLPTAMGHAFRVAVYDRSVPEGSG